MASDQEPQTNESKWVMKHVWKTLLGTTIGVLLGGTLTLFLNRPTPALLVQSVGFASPHSSPNSPHARVDIPEALRKASQNSGWAPDLQRFEPFEHLLSVDTKISEILLKLDDASANLDAWRTQYGALLKTTTQLPADILEKHPFMVDDTYLASLIGSISRGGLAIANSNLPGKLEPILDAKWVDTGENQGMYISLSSKRLKLPVSERDTRIQTAQKKALYDALRYGDTKALEAYADHAKKDLLDGAGVLRKLQAEIRKKLVLASALQVRVVIHNSGGRPITFQPWFSAELLHKEHGSQPIHLVYPGKSEGENPFALSSGGFTIKMPTNQPEGSDYEVVPYLTPSVSLEYITVAANGFSEVSLIGVDALGERANDMKALLDTGVLSFRVRGRSTEGDTYSSDAYQFTYQPDENAYP